MAHHIPINTRNLRFLAMFIEKLLTNQITVLLVESKSGWVPRPPKKLISLCPNLTGIDSNDSYDVERLGIL